MPMEDQDMPAQVKRLLTLSGQVVEVRILSR
jgi:hypothetical protein